MIRRIVNFNSFKIVSYLGHNVIYIAKFGKLCYTTFQKGLIFMDLKNTLAELSALPGVSGGESDVANYLASRLSDCDISTDRLGNLTALRRCGRENAPLLMVEAHIDEVGFIITSVTDGGFLKFAPVGSPDFRTLPDSEVLVLSDPPLPGVVSCLPPHLQDQSAMNKYAKTDSMAIDVGLSPETAKKAVKPGTYAISKPRHTLELINGRIGSKALDNRLSAAVIVDAAERVGDDLNCDLLLSFCVQEEVGCRGAGATAFANRPDAAVVLDVTFASGIDGGNGCFEMGKGVTVCLGPYTDRHLSQSLIAACERAGVAWSPEVYGSSTGTDATPIQVSASGVPVAVLSTPIRYMHSPCEVVDPSDIESASAALAKFIKSYGRD